MTFSSSRSRGAILFDRDGTLIRDVPGLRDPSRVAPMPTAAAAVAAARSAGVLIGVVTNQPAIGEGRTSTSDFEAVRRRVEDLLGEFDGWFMCPHAEEADCACRKPRPGLVEEAMARFETVPGTTVVIGDIAADMEAACGAGALSVLVPTPVTLPAEIDEAIHVEVDVLHAVSRALALIDSARAAEIGDVRAVAS